MQLTKLTLALVLATGLTPASGLADSGSYLAARAAIAATGDAKE